MKIRRGAIASLVFAIAALAPAAVALAPRAAFAQDGEGDDEPASGPLAKIGELNKKGIQQLESGKFDEGIATFKKILEMLDKEKLDPEVVKAERLNCHYNIACGHSRKKETKEALEYLEKSVQEGFWDWSHIDTDTDLDNIRNEAKFKEIVAKGKELERSKAKETASKLISKDALWEYQLSVRPVKADKKVKGEELIGKVVVIDLFADIEQRNQKHLFGAALVPELSSLYKAKKDAGLEMVGLILIQGAEGDDAKDKAGSTIDEFKPSYPIGICSPTQLERAHVNLREGGGFPCTLVLDRAGKLRAKIGAKDRSAAVIAGVVEILLAEKAPEGGAKPAPKSGGDEPKKPEKSSDGDKGEKKDDKKDEPKKSGKKDEPI